ncbi:MerR family transcriptional regulator [Paracerasibacillus soli]|uniref:MerR family transcriptional regulator n=1 Tax=Paracerasibacillus soli TaxID=480284 RepID=A0ABU5CT85_9BACI|nr:MerR family transcriptional regulator [Virgibacillus soli]MDY0409593.1 MerR family transcriptional regulator [Virgibacillus soli]
MQIKEVAQQLHTTARTIRYYEEKGLIHPDKDQK